MSAAELAMELEETERDALKRVLERIKAIRERKVSANSLESFIQKAIEATDHEWECFLRGYDFGKGAVQGVASRLVARASSNIHGPEKNRG